MNGILLFTRRTLGSVAIGVVLCAATSFAQKVGGLDAPAGVENRAAMRQVKQPQKVEAKKNAALDREVISGATDADAINEAASRLKAAGGGALYVKTESGLGVVGVGAAKLEPLAGTKNENLILPRRRYARAEAHLAAKAAIARLLDSTSESGRIELARQRALLDDHSEKGELDARETASAFLRGAAFYDCEEASAGDRVFVTVISTPRTQGDVSADSADSLTASNLRAARDLVVREVESGVVPPSGGKVMTIVGDDRRVAWIAWDCAFVDRHPDPMVEQKIRLDAERGAEMNARAALLALLRGERIEVDRTFSSVVPDYSARANPGATDGAKAFQARRDRLLKQVVESESMASIVASRLPPGVETSLPRAVDDGLFVYSVAFFSPESVDAVIELLWPDVVELSPLGKSDRRARAYAITPDGTFERTKDGRLIPKSAATGQVSNKKDL